MFALAISTGFIYPHVVALELTIRHITTQRQSKQLLPFTIKHGGFLGHA
jgi:hypothetical protein